MRPLVTAIELAGMLESGAAIAADVRWYLDGRNGREAFETARIPGAVFVDLGRDLAAPPGPSGGRHPLPSPEHFARAMSAAGIGDDDLVVAYDDTGGSVAARLWWMLDATGHRAAVLDGGLAAWPGPFERGPQRARPLASFNPRPWPAQLIATAEDLGGVVVDARAPERYRGDVEPVDPQAGHIPGAVNAPWSRNLDDAGRFLPADRLRDEYATLGVDAGTQVTCYCGSGVTACHDVLALRVAGIDHVRLYVGSWSDWCSDPSRPVATGDAPR